jgi:serine/threonine protein phosphatase PrpC
MADQARNVAPYAGTDNASDAAGPWNTREMSSVARGMGSGPSFAIATASSRRLSEDRAEMFPIGESIVVVVADGAGGVRGGAMASNAVVEAVRAKVASAPLDLYDMEDCFRVFRAVDADLARSPTGGETTAVVIVVGPRGIAGVSAGDSEAWLVGDGVDTLTEGQDRARLGTGRARSTSFRRHAPQGLLVVATDGLFKAARSESIVACCAGDDVAGIAKGLVELPRLPSGAYADDVAVVVVGGEAGSKSG